MMRDSPFILPWLPTLEVAHLAFLPVFDANAKMGARLSTVDRPTVANPAEIAHDSFQFGAEYEGPIRTAA